MRAGVVSLSPLQLRVVPSVLQSGVDLAVGHRPRSVLIVEIVFAVLEEDSDGLADVVANQPRVIVPPADVGEGADPGDDAAELLRAKPGDAEGCDAAGGEAADATLRRIVANVEAALDLGQQLLAQERGVGVADCVVLLHE